MNLGMFRRRLQNYIKRNIGVYAKKSYSQCGEDIIVRYALDVIGITRPTYLDIGAHHPYYLNNTALFYEQGSRGVNIEADPTLIDEFNKKRKNDINLNIGVAAIEGQMDFYKMSAPTLSTFSKKEAHRYRDECGYKIESIFTVKVQDVTQVMRTYFDNSAPDYVSLDVEGMDLEILKSIDFSKYRPHIFCIETIVFTQKRDSSNAGRIHDIDILMESNDYIKYADTNINTIYVNRSSWLNSKV